MLTRYRCSLVVTVAVLIQVALAYRYYGFLTGDDIEVLGQAFQRATGY